MKTVYSAPEVTPVDLAYTQFLCTSTDSFGQGGSFNNDDFNIE